MLTIIKLHLIFAVLFEEHFLLSRSGNNLDHFHNHKLSIHKRLIISM